MTESPPSGDWWDSLFVEPQADEHVIALIPHPVHPEWVVKNPLSNADR